MTEPPIVPKLLDTAVSALGGSKREGQVRMAAAVAHSLDTGEHLAVQAGTSPRMVEQKLRSALPNNAGKDAKAA